ncbi:hypothetical protein ACFW3Z_25665 [Nocardiopsis alba]|uniref:hypothetical protein n=1 Tax=Nocardiopsis alba TaxID=53437 RepID=UPI00366FE101
MSTTTKKSTKKSKTAQREAEEMRRRWSHQQGPWLAAANAASVSLAAATVGGLPEVGLPVWAPLAVGAIGATSAYTRAATAKLPTLSRLYRPGRWAGFAGWTSLALATGSAWTPEMLAVLGAGAVASALLRPASQAWEIAAQDRKSAETEAKERLDLAVQWERRVDQVCNIKGTTVTDIREWDYPDPTDPDKTWKTGYTVKGKLPPSAGLDALERNTHKLADSADLPAGCGVEVAGLPESRRSFELFISTIDALAQTLTYPETYTRQSIYDGLTNAVYRDGSLCSLDLKWATALLIGATGSGKSSQLAAIMASLLRCDDVIVWGIDPNGGGVFEPYLRPWVEGRVSRPAIDWVATTEDEMHRMLDFALAAVPARKIGYADLMRSANDTKIPVSSAVPHIQIVTDETASLSTELKEKLRDLSDRSRAASIRALICSLRAVSDAIPKSLMAQAQVRMGLKVNEEVELKHLFGWAGRLPSASEMPAEGYGLIRHDAAENPRLIRGLYADPAKGSEVAEATASWRPELDDVTVRVAPGVYMDRWERARKAGWLPGLGKSTRPTPTTSTQPQAQTPAPSTPSTEQEGAPTDLNGMFAGLNDALAQAREQIDQKKKTDETFRALTEPLEANEDRLPRVLQVALDLAEGNKGAAVVDIATKLRWSRPTVRARMAALEIPQQPKPDRWSTGAKPERGYTRESLEAARDAIRAGQRAVPPGIDADE